MSDGPKGPLTDREIANRSGIPLQRHLAELVRRAGRGNDRAWQVEAEECQAGDGFLDLLLRQRIHHATTRMAVEVKRFYDPDGGRPMRLVFLAPQQQTRMGSTLSPYAFPVLPYRHPPKTPQREDLPHRLLAGEFYCKPEAHVAEHCVFETRKGSRDVWLS